MSTTNQFDKTKEETSSRRKRVNVSAEFAKEPKSQPQKVPVVQNEQGSDAKQTVPPKTQELRRKKSASAELEMTETQNQTRRQQKKQQKAEKRKNKKPRLRIFPIWLRIVLVGAISVLALGAGLMIGYGVLGDGEPKDALKWETWQHIIDIVAKEK